METVNLGSTGLAVSRICLGCTTYGTKSWREWVLEEDESRPFTRRPLELGIAFFDTADVYSQGVGEEVLAPGQARGECSHRRRLEDGAISRMPRPPSRWSSRPRRQPGWSRHTCRIPCSAIPEIAVAEHWLRAWRCRDG